MRKRLFMAAVALVGSFLLILPGEPPAMAARIAVFGDNSIDDFLAASGNTVALVDMAFLEKPLTEKDSLGDYDIFIYTRTWSTFGEGLSQLAAQNVKAFVSGNVVLFLSDMADMIGSPQHQAQATDLAQNAEKALLNAVDFVSRGGKGFIGEFNGAAVALSSNTSGQYGGLALGLVEGTFTGLKYYPLENSSVDFLSPVHPVGSGLPGQWDLLGGLDYLFTVQVSDPAYLAAIWTEGPEGARFPAIIATPVPAAVPEPATFLFLLFGGGALATFSIKRPG